VIMEPVIDDIAFKAEQLEALLQTLTENSDDIKGSQLKLVLGVAWNISIEIQGWLGKEVFKNDEN
jgi:hypothetical protein